MKILIAGDFCPQNRVAELFDKSEFDTVLGEVKPIIEQADYSIVNFESPVCKGSEKPIEKCGPNLKCSEKDVEAVKWAGFDCVTLANNHFMDYGKDGVQNTLGACCKYDIETVGGGLNLLEASRILYIEINGQSLAIINCCEHEFSIATEDTAGSNPLNPICQYYSIQEARQKVDYVLVIVHGGNEYYQLPSPRMQETYRFFIDAGADAVVNHHQHCYSGYEVYNGKPIFYGLGNFCFDNKRQRDSIWNEGYMVYIEFGEQTEFEMHPYFQCNDTPQVTLSKDNRFYEVIKELNKIISDKEKLRHSYDCYIKDNCDLHAVFSPYTNRFLFALCRWHLLPSFVTRKKKTLMKAYIQCESHLPKVIQYLKR